MDKYGSCHKPIMGGYAGGLCKSCWDSLPDSENTNKMSDEAKIRATMISMVELYTQDLTDLELAVLNNVAQLDQDPRGRLFDYDKVKGLFANGDKMHDETKLALAAIVNNRL